MTQFLYFVTLLLYAKLTKVLQVQKVSTVPIVLKNALEKPFSCGRQTVIQIMQNFRPGDRQHALCHATEQLASSAACMTSTIF